MKMPWMPKMWFQVSTDTCFFQAYSDISQLSTDPNSKARD
jgi:hypothetical protein